MRRLQNIASILIVWATATSTLLASVPHCVCRCPDGSIKYFCFAAWSGETSSCCAGQTCCAKKETSSGEQSKPKRSCCQQRSTNPKKDISVVAPRSAREPGAGPVFQATGCQKTLEQSEAQSLPRMSADANEIYLSVYHCLPVIDGSIPIPSTASTRAIWQIHGPPPPTDFVTTLHRLTI